MITAVSIEGDRVYTLALKAFAESEGEFVGKLVRSAMDEKYGAKLKPYIDFFTAQRGDKNLHSGDTSTQSK